MTLPDVRVDRATVERRLIGLILDVLHVEVPSTETDLIDGGFLDSLGLVSLIAALEPAFEIELALDDFDVEQFRTVERMARLVAETPGSGTSG